MGMQYLGYRQIIKLESAADFKLLNDQMRALWIKIMGNLTAKDMTSDAQSVVAEAFGQQLNAIDAHITQMTQMDETQNGRLLALEEWKETTQVTLDDLIARVTALEEWQATAQTTLEDLIARVTALEGANAAT